MSEQAQEQVSAETTAPPADTPITYGQFTDWLQQSLAPKFLELSDRLDAFEKGLGDVSTAAQASHESLRTNLDELASRLADVSPEHWEEMVGHARECVAVLERQAKDAAHGG